MIVVARQRHGAVMWPRCSDSRSMGGRGHDGRGRQATTIDCRDSGWLPSRGL